MREHETALETAKAVYVAHAEAYDALRKTLTPTPRKASTKKQASAPAQKETTPFDTDAKCGICGHTADHSDHDRNYIKSHDFELPKSVARAPRKLKLKTDGLPSAETEKEPAIGVGAGD